MSLSDFRRFLFYHDAVDLYFCANEQKYKFSHINFVAVSTIVFENGSQCIFPDL